MFKYCRLKVTSVSLLAFVISNIYYHCPPTKAADAATGQAIVDLIRHANIVNSTYKLNAAISDEEALITTQRKPKATDADCKILSALIAKTAFEAVPETIQRVKVILLDYDADASSSVVVPRAVIKLYGSGGLSDKELLGSLALTTSGGSTAKSAAASTVQPGPQEVDRMLLLGRIENLKSKGTNISAFMNFFTQIEESAKNGDEKGVASKITYLREHLTEQEKLVKQAQAASTNHTSAKKDFTSAGLKQSTAASAPGNYDPDMLAMTMRVANLQSRLMLLDASKVDMNYVNTQLMQVANYMSAHNSAQADKVMTNLEAKIGH